MIRHGLNICNEGAVYSGSHLPSHLSSSVFEINVAGRRIKRAACINSKPKLIKLNDDAPLDFTALFAQSVFDIPNINIPY